MAAVLQPDRVLDCRGQYCPAPVLRAREEIDQLQTGQVLQVVCSDPASREDIARWAKRAGHELVGLNEEDGALVFYVKKG